MKKVSKTRWAILAFVMAALIVLFNIADAEVIWTDFTPKPAGEPDATTIIVADTLIPIAQEVHGRGIDVNMGTDAEVKTDNEINKEKYRVYFEDKGLVLMVLGGLEYWRMNCGTLTATGEYFVKMAIKKHNIDEEEMSMDMSFQTGLFAATLYNDCDHFLNQVKTIGLDMMFVKEERTNVETLNNISDSEV